MLHVLHDHHKTKIKLLVVLLAAITPFLIIIFYLFDLWYDTRRQLVIEENLTRARLVATHIDSTFHTGASMALLLGDPILTDILHNADVINDKTRLKQVLTIVQQKVPGLVTFSLFDPSGNVEATSENQLPNGQNANIADREYFKDVLTSKKPTRSGVLKERLSGKYLTNYAVPILTNDTVTGVAIAASDLEELKKRLEIIVGDTSKSILLIDHEGRVAFRLFQPMEDPENLVSIATNQHVQNAIQGQESIFEFETLPTMPEGTYVGAAVPIGVTSPPWVVISVQSATEIFAPIVNLQSSMWIILGSALIFSFALISYILRKIRVVY